MTEARLRNLKCGTVLLVRTQNTTYRFERMPNSKVNVEGHSEYCPTPKRLLRPWPQIKIGYRMEIKLRRRDAEPGHRPEIFTSIVTSIEIDALATALNQRFR